MYSYVSIIRLQLPLLRFRWSSLALRGSRTPRRRLQTRLVVDTDLLWIAQMIIDAKSSHAEDIASLLYLVHRYQSSRARSTGSDEGC